MAARVDLQQQVGRKLVSVTRSVHVYGDDRTLLQLWLDMGDLKVHVTVDAAGIGLDLDDEPVRVDYDMEQYGRVAHEDASGSEPFDSVVGQTLSSVQQVFAAPQRDPIGVLLRFAEGGRFWLVNWADQLVAASEQPTFLSDVRLRSEDDRND